MLEGGDGGVGACLYWGKVCRCSDVVLSVEWWVYLILLFFSFIPLGALKSCNLRPALKGTDNSAVLFRAIYFRHISSALLLILSAPKALDKHPPRQKTLPLRSSDAPPRNRASLPLLELSL